MDWQRERNRVLREAESAIRAAAEAGIAAVQVPSGRALIADIRRKVRDRRSLHWIAIVDGAASDAIAVSDVGDGAHE